MSVVNSVNILVSLLVSQSHRQSQEIFHQCRQPVTQALKHQEVCDEFGQSAVGRSVSQSPVRQQFGQSVSQAVTQAFSHQEARHQFSQSVNQPVAQKLSHQEVRQQFSQ